MDPQVQQSATLRDLHEGLRRGEFIVLYQPIVELGSEKTVAAEALVRWDHPTRGRVGPDEFIPLAEQSGLIIELGLRVLEVACRAVVAAEREGRWLGRVSVNVAGRQLQEPDFVHDVLDVLQAAGLEPSRLILEVTESTLGHDRALAVQSLVDLRRQGILVVIDDFGTGYSSLSRFTHLPVDILKIDKSFVGATGSGAGGSIIAAVTALAESDRFDEMLGDLIDHWQRVYVVLEDGAGVLDQVNLVSVDMELVVLTGPEHIGSFSAGASIPCHSFITRLVDNTWVISALARRLPVPGWPPSERVVEGLL
jgi:EAL domain-containing protein (putative c-di-GMP-specific phosphodiesterase class I)